MKHARADYNRIQDPHKKIPDDEPVFLLRGQDMATPAAMGAWLVEAERIGAKSDILDAVRYHLGRVIQFQSQYRKVPDLPELKPEVIGQSQPSFFDALKRLLNSYGQDAKATTPDYELASYLCNCLSAYSSAHNNAAGHFSTSKKELCTNHPNANIETHQ